MHRPPILVLFGMLLLIATLDSPITWGGDRVEAGSTVRPGGWWPSVPEAGSMIRPRRSFPESPEAGSTIRPHRWWPELPEAGSQVRPNRPGSSLPAVPDDRPPECCSASASEDADSDRGAWGWNTSPRVGGGVEVPEAAALAPGRLVLEDRRFGLLNLLGYLLTFGAGAVVAIAAARTASKPSRELHLDSRRFALASDLIQQMDAFLSAVQQEDLARCRAALDAIHAQTGQRLLLLSREVNEAVPAFLAVAVECWTAGRRPEFLRKLGEKYRIVCEELRRELGQEEPLSDPIRQSLEDPQQSHRSIR